MTPKRHKHTYKLAPAQEGMLQHVAGRNPGGAVEQIVCSMDEPIEPTTLKSAWRRITDRHDALRSSFHHEAKEPHSCVHNEVGLAWKYRDISGLTGEQRETELDRWLTDDAQTGFELDRAPLFRLNLFRLGDKKWCLVWSIQRGILDSRSVAVVLTEVFRTYDAERRRENLEFPAVPNFCDYLDYLNHLNLAQAEKHWRTTLEGFTRPTSLAAFEGPSAGSAYREERIHVSGSVSRAIAEVAARERFTVSNAVEAAWAIALGCYNSSSDVVFGTMRACRGFLPRAGSMVGKFVNAVPVRVKITDQLSILDLLRHMRVNEIAVREFEHTPLARIESWTNLQAGTRLFDSVVAFHHAPLDLQMQSPHVNWTARKVHRREHPDFPLTLTAYAEPELQLHLAYDAQRFCQAHIEQALGHLQTILQDIASGHDKKIADFAFAIEPVNVEMPVSIGVEDASRDDSAAEPPALPTGMDDDIFTLIPAEEPMGGQPLACSAIPVPAPYDSLRVSDQGPVIVASGLVPVSASPLMPQRHAGQALLEWEQLEISETVAVAQEEVAVEEICVSEVYAQDGSPDDEASQLQAVLAEVWCSGLGQPSTAVQVVPPRRPRPSLKRAAARLFESIRNRFEWQHHITTLSTAPDTPVVVPSFSVTTVDAPSDSALVAIQPNGSRPPLFCIGALEQESEFFQALSAQLGNEQPVYGIDPNWLTNDPGILGNVKKLAHHCIAELRALGHNQPYCLLGYSFGGLVALEMAQQLRRSGTEVPALVLIDTYYEAGCKSHESVLDRAQRYRYKVQPKRGGAAPYFMTNLSPAEQRAAQRYRARAYSGRACVLKSSSPRPFLDGGSKIGWDKIFNDSISIYFDIAGEDGFINTAKQTPLIARRVLEFLGGVEEYRKDHTLSRLAS